jgi:serine/threonine protein kinase
MTSLYVEPRTHEPARIIGRYALYEEIASGGMATVHYGRLLGPVGFSRTVAIKRLHPQYAKDPEFATMFIDEARLAARVRHPNVVQTLDVVATDGELFLVMDYVQGESLSRLLRAGRGAAPVSIRVVSAIMCGALHGLHAAHEATNERGEHLGIVHRDMSPQNVLVGVDGIARVLDFGVAKAAGRATSTQDKQVKGKLGYMAPEQIKGDTTRRSDLFAAAVVLWQALTGRRLFPGDDPRQVLDRILTAPIAPPSTYAMLPPGLDDVVMRALERDPSKRYDTARAMARDLERCAGLASPTEVGEWVESLAHNALARRSQAIAEIESSSSRALDPRGLTDNSGPLSGTMTTEGEDEADSSRRLSRMTVARSRGRARRVTAFVILSILAAAIGAFLMMRRVSATAPFASAPRVSETRAGNTPVIDPPAPDKPPPGEVFPAAPPAGAPSAMPAQAAGEAKAGTKVLVTLKPAPGKRPAQALDCDPPYALDAQGHKHWKSDCFRHQDP